MDPGPLFVREFSPRLTMQKNHSPNQHLAKCALGENEFLGLLIQGKTEGVLSKEAETQEFQLL